MTDTPSDDQRPDNACVLHRPPKEGWPWRLADAGYRTCTPCLDRLREQLADIRKRYNRLDPAPGAAGDDGTRGAPGFRSKSPASDHIICLRDNRSSQTARMWRAADGRLHAEDERPPVSIRSAFDTVCWEVAEQLDIEGPPETADVHDLIRWLDNRLDHVTRHEVCIEVANTVRHILAALKPLTGDPRPRRVGSCPNVVDEDTQERCDQPLYAPLKDDVIRCRSCGRKWQRPDWEKLGLALQGAA